MTGKQSLKELAMAEPARRGVTCAVCKSPKREDIDECLRDGLFATAIVRALAKQGVVEITVSQLKHHKSEGHHVAA